MDDKIDCLNVVISNIYKFADTLLIAIGRKKK